MSESVPVDYLECPCCGDVGAEADAEGLFSDGQELVCGCPGVVGVDEDDVHIIPLDDDDGGCPHEMPFEKGYQQGRESFRREVAEALRKRQADAWVLTNGISWSHVNPLEAVADALEAGTFPKPPPSSGGQGGGT